MQINKGAIKPLIGGLIIGLLWFIMARALFFYPDPVHYHANFAVFIDGERVSFDSPIYYEEVQACSQDEVNNPRGRAHLHQPNHDVVHIHDEAVTWGNFFENIGWNLGDDFIMTNEQMYLDGTDGELVFMLNGFRDRQIANRLIKSEDRLLVSFAEVNDNQDELQNQYNEIPANAGEFNLTYDPANCSGSADPSLWQRLKFGIRG